VGVDRYFSSNVSLGCGFAIYDRVSLSSLENNERRHTNSIWVKLEESILCLLYGWVLLF